MQVSYGYWRFFFLVHLSYLKESVETVFLVVHVSFTREKRNFQPSVKQ